MDGTESCNINNNVSTTSQYYSHSSSKENEETHDKIVYQTLLKLLEAHGINLSENWLQMKNRERSNYVKSLIRDCFPNLPGSLITLTMSLMVPGESKTNLCDQAPVWLDREKFIRGQRFARENLFGIYFAELLALFALFSFHDGLKPMIISGKSSEPYSAFKRYLSTGSRVRNWYTSDPWTKGTPAYDDIQIVKRMHSNMRDRLDNLTDQEIDGASMIPKTWSLSREMYLDDFKLACPTAKIGQCPYTCRQIGYRGLNQGEMASTQCGFICLTILFPQAFGIHSVTEEDLEAFCHVWRGIGYLLGIDDEYNFCRGTLEEIRQRSRDWLNFWVKPNFRDISPEWEHMMRCLITGLHYYFPGTSYENALLYLTELMDINMPQLSSSLSYTNWMRHWFAKIILRYGCRYSIIKIKLNKKLNQCMNNALQFTNEKHTELRKKSENTMTIIVSDNTCDKKSLTVSVGNVAYKFIQIIFLFMHDLILWRTSVAAQF